MPFTPAAKDRPGYNQGAGTSLPRSGLLEQRRVEGRSRIRRLSMTRRRKKERPALLFSTSFHSWSVRAQLARFLSPLGQAAISSTRPILPWEAAYCTHRRKGV